MNVPASVRKAVMLGDAGPSPSAVPGFPEGCDGLGRREEDKVLLHQERDGCIPPPKVSRDAALGSHLRRYKGELGIGRT